MVSKLEILERYYQINLEYESDYFVYQGKHYYLGQVNNFLYYYPTYLNDLKLQGFVLIKNCFNKNISNNYILYSYVPEVYQLDTFIAYSLRPLEASIEVGKIKQSWGAILNQARKKISNYASRISHFEHFVVLSYYYQGLGETAINLLNQIQNVKLYSGIEHFYLKNNYETLCNPDNIVIASRIKDLADSYSLGLIDASKLDNYIITSQLTSAELIYLYTRIMFPNYFFDLAINQDCNKPEIKKQLLSIYQNLDNEKAALTMAATIIGKYVYLPIIDWL